MTTTRLIICAVLALPAGWFAGLLVERVPAMGRNADGELRDPDAVGLFEDLPGVRLHGAYLWVHLLTLASFLAVAWRFDDESFLVTLVYLVWCVAFVALTVIDVQLQRLPDRIVLPAFELGLVGVVVVSLLTGDAVSIRYALLGSALYFGFMFVLNLIHPMLAGFGDVKLAAVTGMSVGWIASGFRETVGLLFWSVLIAFVFSAVIGIGLLITSGSAVTARKRRIGQGPWMILGALLVVMLSSNLVTPG